MQGETILCLSSRRWDSLWRSTQQIMSRLARDNRVIWLEPQRDPDVSWLASSRRSARHFLALTCTPINPNLTVVGTPPALPYARQKLPAAWLRRAVPLVARANTELIAWHLGRVMRRLQVRAPILWLYSPREVSLVGRLGEKLSVYFNYDELADFPPNQRIRDVLQAYDEALCRRVDVVLASSQSQYQRRAALNPNTYCVPNGVDHSLFSQALASETAVPPALAGVRQPILGFVGWLGHQLDVPLLLRLAQRYPEYLLVLVGPDALARDAAYAALRAQPNVLFAGRQPLAALPGWLKAFAVALLPYDLHTHAQSIYPLKLHEYLAAGCSVLATALPELRPFAGDIRVAPDAEAFLQLVPAALADNAPPRRQARSDLARQHTWDNRLVLVHQALDQALAHPRRPLGPSAVPERARPNQAAAGLDQE